MKTFSDIGIQVGEILLPKTGTDLSRWSVIACDQFTSQPEYWQDVKERVGEAPSTFHLILPEVYLGTPEESDRVQSTQAAMRRYLNEGLLVSHDAMIYVERTVEGRTRRGLMLSLDLEQYDFRKGSQSLIRATEGTILERLPPRMRIREGACLELPHILVLIDDPEGTVIESLARQKDRLTPLYDTELMLGSGRISGYRVDNPHQEEQVVAGLRKLADPGAFATRYGVPKDKGVLLFAVGDGNHSLATAKSIWEKIKPQVGLDHPARYALVEIENVHDEGLIFEPIHRVIFGVQADLMAALNDFFGARAHIRQAAGTAEMLASVRQNPAAPHVIGVASPQGYSLLSVDNPSSNLPVGTLQAFLDDWGKKGGFKHIDYVHGDEVTIDLGSQAGNLGFVLPAMNKSDLFKTVILDGALPRKTFSMGEAKEKRFYMESRRINS